MKNIHRINGKIYITNDEEIKDGDCILHNNKIHKVRINKGLYLTLYEFEHIDVRADICKKIILTTDPDLIKDGVQAISDEFLEWFVKNPSCEEVEVESKVIKDGVWTDLKGYVELPTIHSIIHKIIIPKEEPKQFCENCKIEISKWGCACGKQEEPKQETLEEALGNFKENHTVLNLYPINVLQTIAEFGAKWQQQQNKNLYSEEEVELIANEMVNWAIDNIGNPNPQSGKKFDEVIAKYKKK